MIDAPRNGSGGSILKAPENAFPCGCHQDAAGMQSLSGWKCWMMCIHNTYRYTYLSHPPHRACVCPCGNRQGAWDRQNRSGKILMMLCIRNTRNNGQPWKPPLNNLSPKNSIFMFSMNSSHSKAKLLLIISCPASRQKNPIMPPHRKEKKIVRTYAC